MIKAPISDLVTEVAGRLKDLTLIGNPEILVEFFKLPAGSIDLLENVYLEIDDYSVYPPVCEGLAPPSSRLRTSFVHLTSLLTLYMAPAHCFIFLGIFSLRMYITSSSSYRA